MQEHLPISALRKMPKAGGKRAKPTPLSKAAAKASRDALEDKFEAAWRLIVRTDFPERQWRFHPVRKWTFDFTWPSRLLAVEIHGGIWQARSGHNRGGVTRDAEKSRTAQAMGWCVLAYTTDDMKNVVKVVEEVAGILGNRRG